LSRRLRTLEDLGGLRGKRILVRCDFNVPLEDGQITDDFRITASLPTIRELLDAGASLVLCSHLGRPKGQVRERERLAPVSSRLSELLGTEVRQLGPAASEETRAAVGALGQGQAALLENLRFDPGEESNDPVFADALAALGQLYVDDAFGAAHRAHASVVGVAERLPSASGRLMQREVEVLSRLLEGADRPYVAILGGAKVSDKLATVNALIDRVDALLIGGAMAFTFLAANGAQIGTSLMEPARFDDVRAAMASADSKGVLIQLPDDVVVAPEPTLDAPRHTVPATEIPNGEMGLDIGPRAVEEFARSVADAKTILWNGPMGMFELEPFSAGTRGVATAVASAPGFSVVGGGDSLAALRKFGLTERIDHLSTGGGASLEFLEGRELPGVAVLMTKD